MPAAKIANSQKRKRVAPLYRSAKISAYRFRKVLEQFAMDSSATDAAQVTRLSVNSVHAIYRKLRVFFFEAGLFTDFYEGEDPAKFESDNPRFERDLLAFHLDRVGAKRGLRSPSSEPPYHFAESCWRYDFKVLMKERPSEAVHAMMLSHLLEIIRLCGPVGSAPSNLNAGALAIGRQIDQRILWLERSAPGFADADIRARLRAARAIGPEDL
jgi:hypothetical protein